MLKGARVTLQRNKKSEFGLDEISLISRHFI
jgi:hypothetical protein